MRTILHVVPRPDPRRPTPLAEELIATAASETTLTRVLELGEPAPPMHCVDLTLAPRDAPELVSVLMEAEEVHAHRLDPATIVGRLPKLRPDALVRTPLLLHGVERPTESEPAWPGPLRLADEGTGAATTEPWIDPSEAWLQPRPGGPGPIAVDGGYVAIVALSASLDGDLRRWASERIEELAGPRLRFEIVDEGEAEGRVRRRRTACAFVGSFADDEPLPRSVLEALCQGVPTILTGGREIAGLRGPVFLPSEQGADRLEHVLATLATWAEHWARGEPAPSAVADARAWVLASTAFRARTSPLR